MILLLGRAAGLNAAQAPESVALPDGVKAVWSEESAFHEVTATRERISINGLWRWQPAT